MTRVTIYQPQYFPRLHYFNRILSADIFVLLESAQYTKTLVHESDSGRQRHKSYQADTPIKTNNGEYFLTVSTKHAGDLHPINQTGLEYMHNWHRNHLLNIKANYRKASQFETLFPHIEKLLLRRYDNLADLNVQTTLWAISELLGLDIPADELTLEAVNSVLKKQKKVRLKRIVRDTELSVTRPEGVQKGTEWTTAICEELGATEYVHGGTAQTAYMDLDYYKKRGIIPVVQEWKCPVYTQQYKSGFIPNLSIIDLLLNEKQTMAVSILNESAY